MKKSNFETVIFRDELYYGQELDYPLIKEGDTNLATALSAFDCNCVLECLYPKLFGYDKLVVSVLNADSCHIYADKIKFYEPKGWIVNGNPMCESLMPIKGRISKFGMVNIEEFMVDSENNVLDNQITSSFQLRLWRVRKYSAPLSLIVNGMCDNDPLVLKNCDYTAELEFRETMAAYPSFRLTDLHDSDEDLDVDIAEDDIPF